MKHTPIEQFGFYQYNFDRKDLLVKEKVLTKDIVMHSHDYFEIEFVLSGTGKTTYNGKQYPLSKGSLSILTPLDVHDIILGKGLTLCNICIQEQDIAKDMFELILSKNLQHVHQVSDEDYDNIYYICKLLQASTHFNKRYKKNLIDCIMHIVWKYAKTEDTATNIHKTPEQSVLAIKVYIKTNYRQNISLESISSHVGLDPTYLGRLFKKHTNTTPMQYVLLLRLLHANTLLTSTNNSLTDICYESGFGSMSNFLKQYKNHFKISPTEMRKKHPPRSL